MYMGKYQFLKILIAVSFVSVWVSCKNSSPKYKPTTTSIEGQITSAESPNIKFLGIDEQNVTLDANGKFTLNTKLSQAGIYRLLLGYQAINIYLEPGNKVSFTSDFRNPANTKFTGDHATENNYLVAYEKSKADALQDDFKSLYSLDQDAFLKKIEERTQKIIQHQQNYQKENEAFAQTFAEVLSEDISYDASIMKLNYPTYYSYFNPDSTLILSDTYDSFLQNLTPDKESNLLIPSFRSFIPLYLTFQAEQDTTQNAKSDTYKKFQVISKNLTQKSIKEIAYYELLKEAIQTEPNGVAEVISDYTNLQTNPVYNQEINTMFNSWRHLIKGNPAPEWNYRDSKNKEVSLSSLKGKVVYIDVWATWCGPCLRELPHLEKLQEHYSKSSDIVFVSISIDQDKNAWAAMLKDKQMKGTQLIADNAWSSKIVSDYRINGIPRFMIIGRDGNIVDANAIRPSSKKLISILDKAINL
jgi:thiol-disulfide isomerase/thioredoxin